MKQDNSIGILGLDHKSTQYYINQLQCGFHAEHGGYHTLAYLLYQVDFHEVNPHLPDMFKQLDPIVTSWLNQLSQKGITHLLVPNITLHRTIDRINTPIHLIHPVELLKSTADQNGASVMILGSIYTMESDYIAQYFTSTTLDVISPVLKQRNRIDEIRKKVFHETVEPQEVEWFNTLIRRLGKRHQVVIACTELSQIVNKDCDCIDLVDLQIQHTLKLVR